MISPKMSSEDSILIFKKNCYDLSVLMELANEHTVTQWPLDKLRRSVRRVKSNLSKSADVSSETPLLILRQKDQMILLNGNRVLTKAYREKRPTVSVRFIDEATLAAANVGPALDF